MRRPHMKEELLGKITAKDEAMYSYSSPAVTQPCDIRRLQSLPDNFHAVCWRLVMLEPKSLRHKSSHILKQP